MWINQHSDCTSSSSYSIIFRQRLVYLWRNCWSGATCTHPIQLFLDWYKCWPHLFSLFLACWALLQIMFCNHLVPRMLAGLILSFLFRWQLRWFLRLFKSPRNLQCFLSLSLLYVCISVPIYSNVSSSSSPAFTSNHQDCPVCSALAYTILEISLIYNGVRAHGVWALFVVGHRSRDADTASFRCTRQLRIGLSSAEPQLVLGMKFAKWEEVAQTRLYWSSVCIFGFQMSQYVSI